MSTAELHAAILAAKYAQLLGLPPGNMWEPGIARNLTRRFAEVGDWATIEAECRIMWGLS